MAKMFFLKDKQIDAIKFLNDAGRDGNFIVLYQNDTYCDIAQKSEKYDNVKLVCVPCDFLDWTKELK